MKTIEEFIESKILELFGDNDLDNVAGDISTLSEGIKLGVKFAQLWIPAEEELPIAYEIGNWDGLRSEFVIAKCNNGNWHKARIYSGFIDGHNFCDWAKEDDSIISNVIEWRPIELK